MPNTNSASSGLGALAGGASIAQPKASLFGAGAASTTEEKKQQAPPSVGLFGADNTAKVSSQIQSGSKPVADFSQAPKEGQATPLIT